jgi:hypothetical protein
VPACGRIGVIDRGRRFGGWIPPPRRGTRRVHRPVRARGRWARGSTDQRRTFSVLQRLLVSGVVRPPRSRPEARTGDDLGQHIAHIILRIDAVQLQVSMSEAMNDRPMLATAVGAGEANGALDHIMSRSR